MIIVDHLDNSRSHRVLWLLQELGLEYEVKLHKRDPKTMLASASPRQVHSLGKSPVITEAGLTAAESGATIEYMLDNRGHGPFASLQRPMRRSPDKYPPRSEQRRRYVVTI